MLTVKKAARVGAVFSIAMFAVPAVLLISAVVHGSGRLAWYGGLLAVLMAVVTVVTRVGGESSRLLGGWVDDERHAEYQLRAWANAGQVLMLTLLAIYLVGVVRDGEDALRGGTEWIVLFLVGGAAGAATVLWLRARS